MMARRSPSNSMEDNITEIRMSQKSQFALEMDHMADCVIHNQKLMELIYQSAQTGQAIALPAVKGLDTTRGPAPRILK